MTQETKPQHTMIRGQCAGAHVFDVNDYLSVRPTCPACLDTSDDTPAPQPPADVRPMVRHTKPWGPPRSSS